MGIQREETSTLVCELLSAIGATPITRAGVPATISTLWDVNDDVTTELLVEFHRRFASGTSAAEALRLAQLQVMRSTQREPRAWAAFIYTGP